MLALQDGLPALHDLHQRCQARYKKPKKHAAAQVDADDIWEAADALFSPEYVLTVISEVQTALAVTGTATVMEDAWQKCVKAQARRAAVSCQMARSEQVIPAALLQLSLCMLSLCQYSAVDRAYFTCCNGDEPMQVLRWW